ncbi:transposase [Vibrio metschnikovii]|uniref:transposase n=1 Tax=Vibrio metschnikovii TaxID=28172 RepID=UPI002FC93B74
MIVPWVNKEIMSEHLKQISAITEKGRHVVVVMDGADWHTSNIADHFHNVNVLKLPPYSPELNPIEQVWNWLRQHCLANQSFIDYNDIVSKMRCAWNRFLSSTDRVTKICSRDWTKLTS